MISIVVVLIMFVAIWLMFRNEAVHNEQMRVIQVVSNLARIDIKEGRDWKWRYEAFDEISYYAMLFQLWKPVKSFYDGHYCLARDK